MWWTAKYWWNSVEDLDKMKEEHPDLQNLSGLHDYGARIHPTAVLDDSEGPIVLCHGVKICEFASIAGPIIIGRDTLIGKGAQVRGPTDIGRNVLIGSFAEVKRSILCDDVKVGPGCYVGDSYLEEGVFLGAHVRTSNYRLDGGNVQVMHDGQRIETGMRKLGCKIGTKTEMGVGCRIYPGREVPSHSIFDMNVRIMKNLPPGKYRIKQELETF